MTSGSEFYAIDDEFFDGLPRETQAALMREYGRTQGIEMSAHQAGLLAGQHSAGRLAEAGSQAAAAHEGFSDRCRAGSGRAMYAAEPWEIGWPTVDGPARERKLEAGA
jgi:hypothetical protein